MIKQEIKEAGVPAEKQPTPAQIAALEQQRAKKNLAVVSGNPNDKIVINPEDPPKKVQTEEKLVIERVINIMQRRKRSLRMKLRKTKITRSRSIKRTRMASNDQLLNRARRMAKTMLRRRVAGSRGEKYSKLSPAQKMNIDRLVEPRTKNIGAMATRMMPRVKAGEMRRLNAVRSHKSTKGVYGNLKNLSQSYEPVLYSKLLGETISAHDLNMMFSMYEGKFISALTAPVRAVGKTIRAAGAIGAATAAALSSPQATAAATGALAAYGVNKLANFGKYTPPKNKTKTPVKSKTNTTAPVTKKPVTNSPVANNPVANNPVGKPVETASKPNPSADVSKNKPVPATNNTKKAPPVANKAPTKSPFAQKIDQIKANLRNPNSTAQTFDSIRRAKQAAAVKAIDATATPASGFDVAAKAAEIRQEKQAAAAKAIDAAPSVTNTPAPTGTTEPTSTTQSIAQRRQKRDAIVAAANAIKNAKAKKAETSRVTEENVEEGGLWANIHAKRKRIKAGSGEHMRKPGSKGAPTKQNLIDAQESLEEGFVVDRAAGYSTVYTAADLGMKIQGGFAYHPSVMENDGAGFDGTSQLSNKYKKDTPGQAVEAFARMMRAKRKANTQC